MVVEDKKESNKMDKRLFRKDWEIRKEIRVSFNFNTYNRHSLNFWPT